MPRVEYFISERSRDLKSWQGIYKWVADQGCALNTEPVECDISIVLSGKFVNPLPLHGKKILLYSNDWSPLKWEAMFEIVLEEYYDEMINVEGKDIGKVIEKIRKTNS
jgi:hypothetical protein